VGIFLAAASFVRFVYHDTQIAGHHSTEPKAMVCMKICTLLSCKYFVCVLTEARVICWNLCENCGFLWLPFKLVLMV